MDKVRKNLCLLGHGKNLMSIKSCAKQAAKKQREQKRKKQKIKQLFRAYLANPKMQTIICSSIILLLSLLGYIFALHIPHKYIALWCFCGAACFVCIATCSQIQDSWSKNDEKVKSRENFQKPFLANNRITPSFFSGGAGSHITFENLTIAGPGWNGPDRPANPSGLDGINVGPDTKVTPDNVRMTGLNTAVRKTSDSDTPFQQTELNGVLIEGNETGVQLNGPARLKMTGGAIKQNKIGLQVNSTPNSPPQRLLLPSQVSNLKTILKSYSGTKILSIGSNRDLESVAFAKQLEVIAESAGISSTIFLGDSPNEGVFVLVKDVKNPPKLANEILSVISQAEIYTIGGADPRMVSDDKGVVIFVGMKSGQR